MDLDTFDGIRTKLDLTQMGKPALIGIVAIFIMVAVLAGRNIIGTATAKEYDLENSPEAVQGAEESETAQPESVFVHVSGAVAEPGLYEVEKGARVARAIEAAGGFSEGAAVDSVNLARVVSDGEMIVVSSQVDSQMQGSAVVSDDGNAPNVGQRLNINTASAADLEELPGIGPSTAGKIVADRLANGPFKTTEDLKRVQGIGDKKYDSLVDFICV